MIESRKISVTLNVLAPCVHRLLESQGVSTVRVLQSINAHLGKMTCTNGGEATLGVGKLTGKGLVFQQSENLGTAKYEIVADVVGRFKAWQDVQARLEKSFGEYDLASVPIQFKEWIAKHKVQPTPAPVETPAPVITAEAARLIGKARNSKVTA